jgi:hypothetical protein
MLSAFGLICRLRFPADFLLPERDMLSASNRFGCFPFPSG